MIRSHDSERGYTLIEILLTMMVVATLVTSLVYVQMAMAQRIEFAQEDVTAISESVAVLGRIEQSIRNAERVLRAGTDVLELSTRYHIDTDTEIEKIHYYRSGGDLYRKIAQGAGAYGTPEVLLEGVTEFDSRALMIEDAFDLTDYADIGTVTKGDPADVDTSVKAEYLVKELGQVDADLESLYDAANESLLINSTVGPRTVTVSPALGRQGLSVSTDFQPIDDAGDYRPIVYGAESSDTTGISVVFAADNSVRLKVTQASATLDEQISGMSWTAGNNYRVWLEMLEDRAVVYAQDLTKATRPEFIGKTDATAIDNSRVHLQTFGDAKSGRWDNLELKYPLVDLHLAVTTSSGVEHLYGGAKRRTR